MDNMGEIYQYIVAHLRYGAFYREVHLYEKGIINDGVDNVACL
jgi:hypothetical protein